MSNNLVLAQAGSLAKSLDVAGDGADLIRKCPFCKEYDSPERMKHNPSSRYYYHAACKQEYRKARSAQA